MSNGTKTWHQIIDAIKTSTMFIESGERPRMILMPKSMFFDLLYYDSSDYLYRLERVKGEYLISIPVVDLQACVGISNVLDLKW